MLIGKLETRIASKDEGALFCRAPFHVYLLVLEYRYELKSPSIMLTAFQRFTDYSVGKKEIS